MEKILNFCPTGTQTTRENSLAPLDVNEIIDDVIACSEIGITLVHLHARDQAGRNSYRKDIFQRIIDGIKKHVPELAICVSLSGRYTQDLSQRTEVLSLRPDMASLTMSSLNFPKQASINEPDTILSLIGRMNDYGVNPEIECFDSGMIHYTNYLIGKGILSDALYINVIFGNLFNAQSDLATVSAILHQLPKNARTCFGGIGGQQLRAIVLGLLEADGVRVGLEDNLYLHKREQATNAQLLTRTHALMEQMQYSCMSSTMFKQLGYGNRTVNCIG